jgi:ABC-type sugar transport system ATPase subunit
VGALLRKAVDERPEISITMITHHIDEVIDFCDRVTVMRDGRVADVREVPGTDKHQLAAAIIGESDVAQSSHPTHAGEGTAPGERQPVLQVCDVAVGRDLRPFSFELARGEILGIAGLDGSGKEALFAVLAGLRQPSGGRVEVNGHRLRFGRPRLSRRLGIAYLAKKREQLHLLTGRSIEDNALVMAYPRVSRAGFIRPVKARRLLRDLLAALQVAVQHPAHEIESLSGGNRQRVMIARLLAAKPSVYVLDEPNRGVDLATVPVVLEAIRSELAATSGVILSAESEDELTDLCDRVFVLYQGDVVGELRKGADGFDAANIYRLMQGVGAA